jgi:hypothetical protein
MSLSRDREAPTGNTRPGAAPTWGASPRVLHPVLENSRFSKEAILRVNALKFLFYLFIAVFNFSSTDNLSATNG